MQSVILRPSETRPKNLKQERITVIITKQKPIQEITKTINRGKKIFLTGCAVCASTCKTGGEKELKDMAKKLLDTGIEVLGYAVLDPACSGPEVKRFCRKEQAAINNADMILSFACGGGTQAIAYRIKEKQVLPGNDTLFQGEITTATPERIKFSQKCSLCGQCLLSETAGICPVTACAKALVNGPCGGIKAGKCETDKDLDCAWLEIYERLKQRGHLNDMKKIQAPKDYTKNKKPQRLTA